MSSSCKLGERIQSGIHAFYYKWGHFVGRKPWTVIGGSTIVALIPSLRLSSQACVRAPCLRSAAHRDSRGACGHSIAHRHSRVSRL